MNRDRRRLLQALAAAPLAATLPAWAAPERPRLLVMVYLYGGNDGFNTWVPYTDPLYYKVRPTIAVPRDGVLKLTDQHGLHPSMAPLMPVWEARELALVQGIGYPASTEQHYRDIEAAFTASDATFQREGWVSRALARHRRPEALADAIAFDVLDIRDADPMGPFRGDKLGVVNVHFASDLLVGRELKRCTFEANTLGKASVARAAQLPAPALRTEFPTDPFGNAMRAAVELAAFDRAIPVLHVALNGVDGDKHHSVDCHWKQVDHHGDALSRLATGLASLRSGLKEIGRWDETLVVTYDEFGRSPMENVDRGTHHGHANTHFVMGGRVKGGLLGQAPRVERMHHIGGPPPVIDTRRLWSTVVERWWGLDSGGVFDRRHATLDLLRS